MTVDPKHSSDEECAVMQSSEQEKSLTRAAEAFMANGRLDEAITAYRQLLSLNPGLADAWYNLGYLHRCRRHFEPAITAYRMALTCHIARPEEVHLNLAVILSEHLNRVDEAEVELQAALRLNPILFPLCSIWAICRRTSANRNRQDHLTEKCLRLTRKSVGRPGGWR